MNSNSISLLLLSAIALAFLLTIFILPRRRAPEEIGKSAIHEEKCFVYWKLKAGFISMSSSPSRLSLYNDFFIVALINPTKIHYSQIKSHSYKAGLLGNSLKLNLTNGKSLVIHSKNAKKIQSIIETT